MRKLASCIGVVAVIAMCGVASADDTYYIQDGAFAKIGGISATGFFETGGIGNDTVTGFDITLKEGNQSATLCTSAAFGCKVNDFLPFQTGIVDTGSKLLCTSTCQIFDNEVGSAAPSGFVFAGSSAFQGASEQYRLNGYNNTTNAAAPIGSFVLAAKAVSAPEIDPASTATGLTVLLGALAVILGRRTKKISA